MFILTTIYKKFAATPTAVLTAITLTSGLRIKLRFYYLLGESMQKLESSLLLGSFLSYIGITIFKGEISIANSIIALSIAALYAYSQHRSDIDQLKHFNKQISDLKTELDSYKTTHEELKNAVAGIKIAQGFRQVK